MKKLINAPETLLQESLRGFAAAHDDLVRVSFDPTFVARKGGKRPGKVALISGGGAGHEPLHAGFVGEGMLDAACPGQIFTSPTPDQMLAAADAVASDAGILWIVKNYAGDIMNFELAAEMMPGAHATVLVTDDVAVESSLHSQGRRGVAATMIVEKIVGAAAERGDDLEGCRALAERVNAASGSIGVALTSCTVPAAGAPTFQLGTDEIELGVGIHGEPGRRREPHRPLDDIVEALIAAIAADLQPGPDDRLLVLVNGMGATPMIELYAVFDAVMRQCRARGLKVTRRLVGNYCTSLDMQGCSITITKLDPDLLTLWDSPVQTAALRWRA